MSKHSSDSNPFGELMKYVEQFKIPGLDMAPIIESRRKDLDALVEANKAAFESMQAVARKQAEILTQTMQGLQDSVKSVVAAGVGTPDMAKQSELARSAYQKALADMTALAEMARKSQSDAMVGIAQRATQSLLEIKALMQPK